MGLTETNRSTKDDLPTAASPRLQSVPHVFKLDDGLRVMAQHWERDELLVVYSGE